ncbi:response regulator [Paenibacillus sp. GCM10023248]|uniref:response regulator n=1 Tax=unclassified Paenibacillus TaxID=185978 RepID=UPI002379BE7F|nr:response regulator [Paenibacillus sp. MAHUQ-63]MDD9271770.1 response regulator [Paenibacillus sp. MAHUQ-63]
MKVLLVDDEPLALRIIENMLAKYEDVEIIASLIDPMEALKLSRQKKVDAVILDLEMPGIGGLELAARISSVQPDVQLVFVTAYNQYAVEAFELNALDYLLKPISQVRLDKTMDRLYKAKVPPHHDPMKESEQTQLTCFHSLRWIHSSAVDKRSFVWRTSKSQELFILLLHHRHEPTIRKEAILEVLWPDHDPVRATVQLHTTVYQIRKMLKDLGVPIQVLYEQEGYRLQLDQVHVDVDVWEESLSKAPALDMQSVELYKQLLDMYKGDYFADFQFHWVEGERERLRLLRWQYLQSYADFCLAQGLLREAGSAYLQMREHNPLVEDGYWGLMRVNQLRGDYAEVKQQYEALCSRLDEELGIRPSPGLMVWMNQLFEQR